MAFIDTVAEDQATGAVEKIYDRSRESFGYVPNMAKAFSHRPEVMNAWNCLLSSIKVNMDVRRYELVTIAAARALRSSYCMLSHGSVLLKGFFSEEELIAVVSNSHQSKLDESENAIMEFAEKVVRDASSIDEDDVSRLRTFGLSDAEIFDIVAAASVRCFFSKTLDALGFKPDSKYNEIATDLRRELVVGRAIEGY